MADNVMPNDIRFDIDGEWSPRKIGVFDAVTGETVQGVMEVNIHLSHESMKVDIVHTLHWPTTEEDYAVNTPPMKMTGRVIQGVNCKVTTYWLRTFTGVARRTEL